MRILLLSTWSIKEGITQATLYPLLQFLANNEAIETIYFCTIEQSDFKDTECRVKNTIHIPIHAPSHNLIHKIWNLVGLPFLLRDIVEKNRIQLLWCKGAPAGGIGFLVNLLKRIPYVVDSFEPHSEYMAQSGTWLRSSPKYLMQRWLENRTIKTALALLPVSYKYSETLVRNGADKKNMFVCPCVVDTAKFKFSREARDSQRKKLMVDKNSTVGIYVGKYGGLYYDDEAFKLYQRLFEFFGSSFFLIVLTEADQALMESKFAKFRLPRERIFLSRVPHTSVKDFLAASDFAISTIKSAPALQHCSPIKHGEYWAADLPILSTLQVGDDAELITKAAGGVLIDISDLDLQPKFSQLKAMLGRRGSGIFSSLAIKHRNPIMLQLATEFVLGKSVTITSHGY